MTDRPDEVVTQQGRPTQQPLCRAFCSVDHVTWERMARIEDIERRLQNWARWKLGATHSGLGYAAMRWAGGVVTPGRRESVIPTIDCEAEETDRAVMALESRLRATVEVEYLQGWSLRRKAQQLACSEPTVKARILQAHRQVSLWLASKVEAARAERERIQKVQKADRPVALDSVQSAADRLAPVPMSMGPNAGRHGAVVPG